MMARLFLIGRLIFGGFFLLNGFNLILDHATATQYAAAKGVPLAGLAVVVAASLILFGGVSIVLGWRPDLGIAAIVLFLAAITIPMHNFWQLSGAARVNEMVNFTKNIALAGGAMMLVAIPQPWPYSVETRRRIFA
jgi:putative oxidoreductase